MFEYSPSEGKKGTKRTLSPQEYNELRNKAMKAEERSRQDAIRKMELHAAIGNDRKAIMEGSNDRVNGLDYHNPYEEGTDKYKSYQYGYYEHGERRLRAIEMENQSKPKSR